MLSDLAQTIRKARRATGLTQEQLGKRLGMDGRTVYRWECGETAPSKRHRQALVTALQAADPAVGEWFAKAMTSALEPPKQAAAPAQATAPPPVNAPASLQLAIFAMADELDLPARRVRGSIARLLKHLGEASVTLDAARQELEQWIAAGQ